MIVRLLMTYCEWLRYYGWRLDPKAGHSLPSVPFCLEYGSRPSLHQDGFERQRHRPPITYHSCEMDGETVGHVLFQYLCTVQVWQRTSFFLAFIYSKKLVQFFLEALQGALELKLSGLLVLQQLILCTIFG